MSGASVDQSIVTPIARAGLGERIARSKRGQSLLRRVLYWLSRNKPFRFKGKVYPARYAHVREALCRDLDFIIAPINESKIQEVNAGPFVLGMDRSAVLERERRALYSALDAVDMDALCRGVEDEIETVLESVPPGGTIDAVGGYARPIAAHTAQRLFGITGDSDRMFMEVTRSIFAHTFLNLGNDETIRQRAIRAGAYMTRWFAEEIARRGPGNPGSDMMGALISQGIVNADGARRTLGGMLVGSVDTTATCVAKVLKVAAGEPDLLRRMERDSGDLGKLHGWCNEALRRWPHNPLVLRQAAVDCELGGRRVKAGDTLWVMTLSAMHDPSVFPAPEQLRPDRDPGIYLHLGEGLHPCSGRPVNRCQIPLLVGGLLRRGIARVGKVGWTGPFPGTLPVTLR